MQILILFFVSLIVSSAHAGYLADTPDSLFIQASEGSIYFQEDVEPARQKLIAMATDSVDTAGAQATIDYLVSMLGTEYPREYHCLRELLPRIGKPMVPALIADLANDSLRAVTLNIEVLGFIRDSSAVVPLMQMVDHPQWTEKKGLRGNTYTALGRIGDHQATDLILSGLRDADELVRKAAAFGLQELHNPATIPALIVHLDDPFFGVRYSVAQALVKLDSLAVDSVIFYLENQDLNLTKRAYLIDILAQIRGMDYLPIFLAQLDQPDPFIRGFAVKALQPLDISENTRLNLQNRLAAETDPFVLSQLRILLDNPSAP